MRIRRIASLPLIALALLAGACGTSETKTVTKTSSATDSKYQACIDEGRPADLCRELQKGSPAYQRCIDEAGSTADLAKEFCRRKTEETTTSTPKVAPTPEGQTSLSCDYLLESGLKDYSFIRAISLRSG
jgi:hypothetical protein